jgi:hypothetical protein
MDVLVTLCELVKRFEDRASDFLPDDLVAFAGALARKKSIDRLRKRKVRHRHYQQVVTQLEVHGPMLWLSDDEIRELSELREWLLNMFTPAERILVDEYYFSPNEPSIRDLAEQYELGRDRVGEVLAVAARVLNEVVSENFGRH